MATAGNVIVNVRAKTSAFDKNLKAAGKRVGTFRGRVDKAARSLKVLAVGVGAAFAAMVHLANRQAEAEAKLAAVLRSTGEAAGFNAKQMKEMARELQAVTTYGDDAIISAQAMLATFTEIKGGVFRQATEMVLNLSAALGQDLKSSAIQLGKALNDPVRGLTALSRVGVSFTDVERALIKEMVAVGDVAGAQAVMLKSLEMQYGKMARALAKTPSGEWKQFANAIGDVGKKLGKVRAGLWDVKTWTMGAQGLSDLLEGAIGKERVRFAKALAQQRAIAARAQKQREAAMAAGKPYLHDFAAAAAAAAARKASAARTKGFAAELAAKEETARFNAIREASRRSAVESAAQRAAAGKAPDAAASDLRARRLHRQRVADLRESLRTPAERFKAARGRLDDLLRTNEITQAEYRRGVEMAARQNLGSFRPEAAAAAADPGRFRVLGSGLDIKGLGSMGAKAERQKIPDKLDALLKAETSGVSAIVRALYDVQGLA